MTSPGLSDFLLSRIAEVEAATRRAAFGYGANWTNETDDGEDWSVVHADGQRDMVGCEDRDVTGHIARHDPARVLAECDAKRRIVEMARESAQQLTETRQLVERLGQEPGPSMHEYVGWTDGLARAVTYLALPYADHPDYRDEWRP